MPVSVDELRQILVDKWCVVSPSLWTTLAARFPTSSEILDYLERKTRFPRQRDPLTFVTPRMREAVESGKAQALLVDLDGKHWLKMKSLTSGGQGEVWIGCPCDAQAKADQLVALKSPDSSKPVAQQSKALSQLQLEIDVLRKIPTSNYIAGLIAADRPSGVLATRLVDGPNLEEKAREERRLSVAQTVQIGIDVCLALQSLHDVRQIHKDVKPENIILDRDRAVLIDFGLAEDLTQTAGKPAGTPYYIAPEVLVALGGLGATLGTQPAFDERADVYSLAATLYRLLVGHPPHFHQCIHPKRDRASRAKLDMLRFRLVDSALDCDLEDVRRDVPRQLSQLLCRALNSNRNLRPSSAANFRADLEAIQSKIKEAVSIERELWALADVLLAVFRDVNQNDTFVGREWDNADGIRNDLDRAVPRFTALLALSSTIHAWTGIASAFTLIPRTIKLLTQVEALGRQLGEFLANYLDADQRPEIATELLKDLIVRTLEGIRSTSVDAIAAAHDWHSVLLQLGQRK